MKAPVATGYVLQVLSSVLAESVLGNALRRILLNDNGIVLLRELASQIELGPLHFPMHIVSQQEWDKSNALNNDRDTSFKSILKTGISNHDQRDTRWRTVMDYHEAYKSGHITPSMVMNNTLSTIELWKKEHFVVFSAIHPDAVMKQARESDARWKNGTPRSVFEGVPIAFKDMMDIKDHLVYEGRSPAESNRPFVKQAMKDDVMVQKFRNAGAIILGLTIMTEGGTSPLGYNSHFQGPVSPYHGNRYSGGSSSGSAVAVATGLVPIAVGYDGKSYFYAY